MHHTRHLLLDCRAALRRTDPGFEDSPLGKRLDSAILEMGQADDARRAREEAKPEHPVAARVAYAWQSVARELRHSHPEVYQRLWDQVLKRLDARAMGDSTQEIEALQRTAESAQRALSAAEAEIAGLRTALAAAVANPARESAPQGGGGMAASPDNTPGPALFRDVAAGARSFAPHELEWCLSEAMVRTGFQRTPVQLLEEGEAGLARLLLETAAAAA